MTEPGSDRGPQAAARSQSSRSYWSSALVAIWILALAALTIIGLVHSSTFVQPPSGEDLSHRVYRVRERLWLVSAGTWLGIAGIVVFAKRSWRHGAGTSKTLSLGQFWLLLLVVIGVVVGGGLAIRAEALPYPLGWAQLMPAVRAAGIALFGQSLVLVAGLVWTRLGPDAAPPVGDKPRSSALSLQEGDKTDDKKFQAAMKRFEDHTTLLRVLTEQDLRILGGYLTVQLGLAAWLAEHPPALPVQRIGIGSLDAVLALIAGMLLYNDYRRRREVRDSLINTRDALQFAQPGAYIVGAALDAPTTFRPWWWWYILGVVAGLLAILLVLFGPPIARSPATTGRIAAQLPNDR